MASPTAKSVAEKSKKKPVKTLAKDTTKPKAKLSKTSNGASSEVRASTTDSERKAATKKPERKPKRERSANDIDDENSVNKFPMERVRRIIRGDDSEIRVTNEAVFLVNKAAVLFLGFSILSLMKI